MGLYAFNIFRTYFTYCKSVSISFLDTLPRLYYIDRRKRKVLLLMRYTARDFSVTLDGNGRICSLEVLGEEVLPVPSPILTLCRGGRALEPVKAVQDGKSVLLSFEDGSVARVEIHEGVSAVRFTVAQVSEGTDGAVFGPIRVRPDEEIGEVLGIARGLKAVGLMSLMPKVTEGVTADYENVFRALIPYADTGVNISICAIDVTRRAATALTGGGCVLQLNAEDRSREKIREVFGLPRCHVQPLAENDPDARIEGASCVLYGCEAASALTRVGEIELEFGLPHPMAEGKWIKTSLLARQSYLISDFGREDAAFMAKKTREAGMRTLYHCEPFSAWGHFTWADGVAESDGDFRSHVVLPAFSEGLAAGLHTLSNFIKTSDGYVSPVPDERLLAACELRLLSPLTAEADSALVAFDENLTAAQNLNAVMAEKEIFTFSEAIGEDGGFRLTGLTRGAFGTSPAPHAAEKPVRLLRDHGYRTLFPDIALQDEMADRVARLFNATGASRLSFDGLEGCGYTGHGVYASARFLKRCYDGFDRFVLSDASRLTHYGWHVAACMNWGEPWGEEMRTAQVEHRVSNQSFFARNLFPRMIGWLLIRLAERRFECTSREDIEWALSESAGFDAGYALTVMPRVMRRHGRIDELLACVKRWDALREKGAFDENLRTELRRPEKEFRLEEDENGCILREIHISRTYTCCLSEMQPGQAGGSDWVTENPLAPSFAFRLRVDGDGAIRDPAFSTALGTVRFPCTVEDGQYLLFDPDGRAEVTDKNYNTVARVTPIGKSALPKGTSAVSFTCDHARDERPDVLIRFITKDEGRRV